MENFKQQINEFIGLEPEVLSQKESEILFEMQTIEQGTEASRQKGYEFDELDKNQNYQDLKETLHQIHVAQGNPEEQPRLIGL